jgi:hypothetical protein
VLACLGPSLNSLEPSSPPPSPSPNILGLLACCPQITTSNTPPSPLFCKCVPKVHKLFRSTLQELTTHISLVANVINHFLHQWFFYICEDDQNRWLISLKERWRCYFLQYRSLLSMLILIMLLYLMKNTSCFALYITSFVLFIFLKWSWERAIWRYLTTYMFIYIINNGLHIEKRVVYEWPI